MMTTLIDVNEHLLSDYSLWENANQGNWNIVSYLNQFYNATAALAFSKLFFPDFIEKEGCVVLGFRYNEQVFKQWYQEFQGETSSVEKYCNLYDVADFFHINTPEDLSEERYSDVVDELAQTLKKSWEINCKLLFPEKNIIVEIINEYGVTRITLYSKKLE